MKFIKTLACTLIALTFMPMSGQNVNRSPQEKTLPILSPKPSKGLYALTNTSNWYIKNGQRINLFDCEVDGVVNYATWNTVESSEGKFNFSGLDRMLSEARQADKKMAFNIIPGHHAPEWLYEKYDMQFHAVTNPQTGKIRKSYLPWEKVDGKRVLNEKFLKVWRNTVKTYADHIYNSPDRDRILYVAITGWPMGNGLELMWPAQNYEEFKSLDWNAEASAIYVEFSKRVIDIYIEAFPDFPLGIAFTDYYGMEADGTHRRSFTESISIVNYALERAKIKGVSVIPMGLWLGHKGINDEHDLIKTMKIFKKEAIGIALEGQMGTYTSPNYIPLNEQLDIAISLGCSWVQLWHHDITYPEYQPILKKYRAELNK